MSLSDAIDAVVAETATVSAIRADPVVQQLLNAYKRTGWAKVDSANLTEEIAECASYAGFDTTAFPLRGTGGIKNSRNARLALQAYRDRLMAIQRPLREGISKTNRVLRIGFVYLRQNPLLKGMTVKHSDAVCEVSLREIVESQETLKFLSGEVTEALNAIDHKTKTLDAWFNLHKQYVFMNGKSPYGDQETHDKASQQQASKLGKRRQQTDDADDD